MPDAENEGTARVVFVAGVSGAGKTTVGRLLAVRLGGAFLDADALHPPANVAKMAAGIPLDDADRWPWLRAVAAAAEAAPGTVVVACSALRRDYRSLLREGIARPVVFVLLGGGRQELAERLARRHGHFMPASLLDSQLATLEPLGPDEPGFAVGVAAAPEAIAEVIAARLKGRSGDSDER